MKITFIGGGNMANALIGGLLGKGAAPEDLRVVEIDAGARARLKQQFGVKCFDKHEARQATNDSDVIVLAVKPQQMREVLESPGITVNSPLIISIAAGVRLTDISRWLGGHTRLVRCMPNTPALIGRGITGIYPMPGHVSREDMDRAKEILEAVGPVVEIRSEEDMDAVTAVSGSGPAYVFYFIEALEEAGIGLGLPRETARQLALETFRGAAELALSSSDSVAVLRQRVTSKGGTTEAALKSLESDGVKAAIVRAVKAADARGRELGDLLGKD